MQLKLGVYVNVKLRRNFVALAALCRVWGYVPQESRTFIIDPSRPGSREHAI